MAKAKPQPIKLVLIVGFAGYVGSKITEIIKSIDIMALAIIVTSIIGILAWSYLIYVCRKKIEVRHVTLKSMDTRNYERPSLNLKFIRDSQKDLSEIMKFDDTYFEEFVASLYKTLGYSVRLTKKTGDGGKDIIMKKDNQTYYVECKKYTGKISSPKMRDFIGSCAIGGDHIKGIYVTTSSYTTEAIKAANTKNIELIDGNGLMRLIETTKIQK